MIANPPTTTASPSSSSILLPRSWRLAALACWVALVLLTYFEVIRGILLVLNPAFDFGTLSPDLPSYLSAAEQAALGTLGITLEQFRYLNVGLDLIFLLVYTLIAAIIVLRKAQDWVALAVSGLLVLYGGSAVFSFQSLLTTQTMPDLGTRLVNTLSTLGVALLAYLFPDGRFVPRWTRWLALFWIVYALIALLVPALDIQRYGFLYLYLLYLVGLITGLYAQVYRYRRVSTPVQRQQTKWIVYGFVMTVLIYSLLPLLASFFPILLEPGKNRLIYGVVFTILFYLSQLIVPLCITFSILRYRLWDIDLIINRTIVYTIVSGLLLLVYYVLGYIFDKTFDYWIGHGTLLSTVAPILTAAFIFDPVRDRTQDLVDHRFYREKIDARRTFAEFGQQLRRTVELPTLLQLLVDRVSELLHIEYAVVYLRNPDGSYQPGAAYVLPSNLDTNWLKDAAARTALEKDSLVTRPETSSFPLLVPLTLPAVATGTEQTPSLLVAVLALGPRLSGLGYSTEDKTLLRGLADQAGTAIYVARLVHTRRVLEDPSGVNEPTL